MPLKKKKNLEGNWMYLLPVTFKGVKTAFFTVSGVNSARLHICRGWRHCSQPTELLIMPVITRDFNLLLPVFAHPLMRKLLLLKLSGCV